MNIFQAVIKILGTAWGVWSIAAFGLGIFFLVVSAAIKKSRPVAMSQLQSYRFFRLAMMLAFFLAIATLITATVKEVFGHPEVPKAERIQRLTLDLKSPDPTQRRQAMEGLIPYGSEAARELVQAINEEAGVVAADLFKQAAGGNLEIIFLNFLGVKPWQTPFMEAASNCLVSIGEKAVPPILSQLESQSVKAERLLGEASTHQSPPNPNVIQSLGEWGFLLGAAGQGMRIGITREVLAGTLVQIGQPAIPDLLQGLESSRILVQMTSYQVLLQIPNAIEPTVQQLQQIANRSNGAERDRALKAIQEIRAQGRH
jgi:hypothetical protein